jgi:hypoxanthine phosphoribosyltransferase
VNVTLGPNDTITGRDIIIVEDIVDSGHSLQALLPLFQEKNPKSLKIATLLFKPEAFKGSYTVDYKCFEIPNDFIVGYGLDYNELGRNLKDIYVLAK